MAPESERETRADRPKDHRRIGVLFCDGYGIDKMHMSDTRAEATEDEIKVCAYFIWEQEGRPVGRALDHWLQAELQLFASLWHDSLWYREG
jgi:hypothetical protein